MLVCCSLLTSCAPPRSSHIVIGSKNFTEQAVLGELLAQEIEASGGGPVERRFWLAGSYLCQQALVADRIDAYPEYTGTALTAILKQPLPKPGTCDEACVHAKVGELYEQRYKVREGPGLGFEDTFAMVVRAEDARRYGLRKISDVAKLQSGEAGLSTAAAKGAASGRDDTSSSHGNGHPLRLGVGYEFAERPDGLRGLSAAYGLHFADAPRTMELGLLYRALAERQVDIVAGNSTDAAIAGLGFVVLEDDRHYFPPYEAVPLVREDSLARWPQIGVAMARLAGKVSAEDMRAMNLAVEVKHQDVGDVVRAFRAAHGL
ncbi:osmoprotectant transport system substrate-binding protein [Bryocella elongata]|uniref:Osmoprotectant transport system substrate-binding protein n=1 Tax=Bryocella elongata TaxID=863522 RepID=A0A1H5T1V6_9BACT|nr:osmoprotectant transport system substrate-binding protein [Bryocella elongata]